MDRLDAIINDAMYKKWSSRWQQRRDKLRKIKPEVGKWQVKGKLSRREKVVFNRLRLAHTNIPHGHLMTNGAVDYPPICDKCNGAILTVKHSLIECSELSMMRNKIFDSGNLTWARVLDSGADVKRVCTYLRECNLFESI